MADFNQKMTMLAERGNPVGAEDLIERVEAELAGDPLVVVSKRREEDLMTKTEERVATGAPRRSAGLKWALAAFVGVLGVGAVFFPLTRSEGREVAAADIAVVESLMEAWNAQDGEAIASHFSADGVYDASAAEPNISVAWIGRSEIAEKTAGFSHEHEWDASFDYTKTDDVIVFNRTIRQTAQTESGTIGRPQGMSVVISNGLIESLVIESEALHYCIGETTSRCKVRDTGEIRFGE